MMAALASSPALLAQTAKASAGTAWTGHDSWLLAVVGISIALVVVLISWVRLHAFLALMVGSFAVSLLSGESLGKVADSFTTGLGGITGKVGILIILGAVLGRLMADSGGIEQIVATLTRAVGPRGLPWAVTLVACLVGLSMFFEVGFVLLVPLVLQIAKRADYPVLRVGIPAMAGLATVHALVPPHPGVLVAIAAVHAQIGLTLVYGLIVAIPCAVVVGPLFTAYIWPKVPATIPETALAAFTTLADEELSDRGPRKLPRFSVTLATVLLPIALMMVKAGCDTFGWARGTTAYQVLEFLGTPAVALLVAILVALVTFGYGLGATREQVQRTLHRSFPPIAGVLVIVGAGGGYSQALADSGVNAAIGRAAGHLHIPLILLAWLVAALMRTATGSGTVATVAAAGIIGPMAHGLSDSHAALLALALGSGAAFLGHVNDAAFWLFKEYFGLSVGGTLRTWTVSHTLLSVTSLAGVLALYAVTS
ncbi:gluconate:H+ symporter [Kitasatospora viridis]|uniref:GntP family gluconate:H+ symporter n=1 Tax=Kitasatospora viridis TaxID=281105 RepID=A0A561S9L9_9ACTN|nr:gluconate:H+ symporter [Kitasatospora viridis]TWF71537.1 GntP family gluconate:H+ symporter [Kitasatospora viridis]